MKKTLMVFLGLCALAGWSGCRGELGYWVDPETETELNQKIWCGDRLCTWSVREGEARPVRTWHDLDPSIRLVGPRVRLSRDDTLTTAGKVCASFQIHLQSPPLTSVRLEVDLGSDGTIDRSEPLRQRDNYAKASHYPSVFRDSLPREIAGTASAGQPARLWFVKEGAEDADIFPHFVTLGACPPPVDAGP
jgi:hypothetical protein